jgi:hypothetical protein
MPKHHHPPTLPTIDPDRIVEQPPPGIFIGIKGDQTIVSLQGMSARGAMALIELIKPQLAAQAFKEEMSVNTSGLVIASGGLQR